mmetsp:Transcript_29889/g.44179  ORF Transcript_29889/g.44179 Transcript_29889/m.44179 type:complete len:535 (-) Transcript_29889:144-1748(-)
MKLVQSITILALSTTVAARTFKGRRTQTTVLEPDELYPNGYAGKKGYGYGGKKGYVEPDLLDCPTGKKGSYVSGKKGSGGKGAGKGGGSIVIPDYGDSCVICDQQNKNKPTKMVLQYVADGANSAFQPAGKATCREGQYPSPARVVVNGNAVYELEDGDLFKVFVDADGGAETDFKIIPTGQAVFDDDIDCYIHTSCSVPIVVGDQIGPFLIEGDEECESPPENEGGECPECEVCDTGRPEKLTLKYHSVGVNSEYQPESKASCRAGMYPTSTLLTVEGSTYDLSDGDVFTIKPQFGGFSAYTEFYFNDPSLDCAIHTSCSVPLMLGDQIGPFEVIGDEDCKNDGPPDCVCEPELPECGGKCIEVTKVNTDPITCAVTLDVKIDYDDLSQVEWRQSQNTCVEEDPNFDSATNTCYEHETALPSDWIGFYPCEVKDRLPIAYNKEPDFWAYTCYDRDCSRDPLNQIVTNAEYIFDDMTLPNFTTEGVYTTINAIASSGGGCYVVVLNRYDGFSAPPYYNICEGNEIMIPDTKGGC